MNLELSDINERIRENPDEYMNLCDSNYISCLKSVAQSIIKNAAQKPVILISGPSGSGKTTTAFLLERLLDGSGYPTHTLSMDNFFFTMDESQKKLMHSGMLDLESPDRLDIDFLSSQLERIIDGKPINLTKYNFHTSVRETTDVTLARKQHELVILEGIHALNPSVINTDDSAVVKLYVSVRTRVSFCNKELHPEKIRIMRRMIRDSAHRGRSFIQTFYASKSVARGEKLYIMPYKNRSDFDIDTFIPYEIGVYKSLLEKKLLAADVKKEMSDITYFLSMVFPADPNAVPTDSLIREFIGGGNINY